MSISNAIHSLIVLCMLIATELKSIAHQRLIIASQEMFKKVTGFFKVLKWKSLTFLAFHRFWILLVGILCTANARLGALHLCVHATVTWSPWIGGTQQYIMDLRRYFQYYTWYC